MGNIKHRIKEYEMQVYFEGESCENCGIPLPQDYDECWCSSCIPSCEHAKTTYQPKEYDTGIHESLTCNECGLSIELDEC